MSAQDRTLRQQRVLRAGFWLLGLVRFGKLDSLAWPDFEEILIGYIFSLSVTAIELISQKLSELFRCQYLQALATTPCATHI